MKTSVGSVKRFGGHSLWLNRPDYLVQRGLEPRPLASTVTIHRAGFGGNPLFSIGCRDLDRLVGISPNLNELIKRAANFIAFKQFFAAEARKKSLTRPILNAHTLEKAFMDQINYVQYHRFGTAVDLLKKESPDALDSILKRFSDRTTSAEEMSSIAELKSLRNLYLCVDPNSMLRISGRLENAELPLDTKHPPVLPSEHTPTRLIVLREHVEARQATQYGRNRMQVIDKPC